ncbi:hypothetical protein C8R43DRAFT_998229 [Mycena crocata]|nr:hypothetical protein C8R43DRAFT_998229 [Mycena crocata]
MTANQIPDEIISEILSPLLRHSDKVFSDPTEKPFVHPGYSTSTYLLVSKAWLRVSTPLLYSVVILRTAAQAQALEKVFQSNKEFGLFVRKLRVEAGFGKAMHTILKCSPKITDLCFSLLIWGSDDVTGLCRGLPLINPQRVILIDNHDKPKKNKKVEALLDALLRLIPKWDNLLTFYLPYTGRASESPISDDRARSILSALSKRSSLSTLELPAWYSFPETLREMIIAPSLTCIRFIRFPSVQIRLETILAQVADDPKLKALVQVHEIEPMTERQLHDLMQYDDYDPNQDVFGSDDDTGSGSDDDAAQSSPAGPNSARRSVDVFVHSMLELEKLGKASGPTVETVYMKNYDMKKQPPANPAALSCFPNLTLLDWSSTPKFSFAKPPPGFSALPRLQTLKVNSGSPSVFELFSNLPLDALQSAFLHHFSFPAAEAFLRRHGPKLVELTASLDLLTRSKVFDLCTSLAHLSIYSKSSERKPERCLHGLGLRDRLQRPILKTVLAALDPARFPALKEIKFYDTKWPTSEQEARKSEPVNVSEILRSKGIMLVDDQGVGWTPRS